MQRFDFNLQKVLDFRQTVEDKKKGEMIKARQKLNMEAQRLELLNEQKQNTLKDYKSFKSSFDYQCYARYLTHVENSITTQKQNLSKAERELEDKNNELLKAMTDKKVLEIIKDKKKAEFDLEEYKKEQKLNDDFAIYSYARGIRR